MGDDGFVAVHLPASVNHNANANSEPGGFPAQQVRRVAGPPDTTVKWLDELDHITIANSSGLSINHEIIAGLKPSEAEATTQARPNRRFQLVSDPAALWRNHRLVDENQQNLVAFRPQSLLSLNFKRRDWATVEYPLGAPIAKTVISWESGRTSSPTYRAAFIPNDGVGSDHIIQTILLTSPFDVEDISGRCIGTVDPNPLDDSSLVRVYFSKNATPFDKLILMDMAIAIAAKSMIQLKHWLFILLCVLFVILVISIYGPWVILLVLGLIILIICLRQVFVANN